MVKFRTMREVNNMKKDTIINEIKESILDIVYPLRCPICDEILVQKSFLPGAPRIKIHEKCMKKITTINEPMCIKCGHQLLDEGLEYCSDCKKISHIFNQGKSLFVYKNEMVKSMYSFKYSNKREYAKFYAEYTYKKYNQWLQRIQPDVIIPVPMHSKKIKKRGYNQSEIYARELSRLTGIPVDNKSLKRVVNTKPLKELTTQQRKNMLKKSFYSENLFNKYKKILLVDDIYTTGSTMDVISEELKIKGIERVYCLSICTGKGY